MIREAATRGSSCADIAQGSRRLCRAAFAVDSMFAGSMASAVLARPDGLLSIGCRSIAVTQSHTAEADGGYFKIAFAEFALLHGRAFHRLSALARVLLVSDCLHGLRRWMPDWCNARSAANSRANLSSQSDDRPLSNAFAMQCQSRLASSTRRRQGRISVWALKPKR